MKPELRRTLAKMINAWLTGQRHTGYLSEETESDAMAALEQIDATDEAPARTSRPNPKRRRKEANDKSPTHRSESIDPPRAE